MSTSSDHPHLAIALDGTGRHPAFVTIEDGLTLQFDHALRADERTDRVVSGVEWFRGAYTASTLRGLSTCRVPSIATRPSPRSAHDQATQADSPRHALPRRQQHHHGVERSSVGQPHRLRFVRALRADRRARQVRLFMFLAKGLRLREQGGEIYDLDVVGRPDTFTILAGRAAVTDRRGLTGTINSTFNEPYEVA